MKVVMALLAGLVFGIGLNLSGMTDPGKVISFLDLAGTWDPSLAFVMAGAVLVGLCTFPFVGGRQKPVLGDAFHLPTSTAIDRRLILGSLTFGVGWGLAGYCPGPVLASLFNGRAKPILFLVAMLAGMGIYEILERLNGRSKSKLATPKLQ